MTREEFSSAKFGAGMKLYHYACQFASEIVTVNFEEDLIGVAGDPDTCETCGDTIDTLEWFRCENCTIIGADGNIIGTPYEGFELQTTKQ